MKIYRVDYYNDHSGSGQIQEWFSNKASAKRRIAEVKKEEKKDSETKESQKDKPWEGGGLFGNRDPSEEPIPMDLKLNKAAIIDFLNKWASNG